MGYFDDLSNDEILKLSGIEPLVRTKPGAAVPAAAPEPAPLDVAPVSNPSMPSPKASKYFGGMSNEDILKAAGIVPPPDEAAKQAVLFEASFGNPSEEAQKRKLSADITRIVGAHEPVLDVKEGMRRYQQLEADHATRASPRTSAFLSVPENAAVAIQDAKTMAQIEAIIGGDPLRSAEIAAKRFAMSTGALGAKVGFDFPAVATDIVGETLRAGGLPDDYNIFKSMSASARRQAGATRSAIEYFTPEARNIVERAAASAGESAGMSLQLLPLATATPQGAGMAAAFGLTTFAESYTKAREEKKTPLEALKYAIPQGAFEGLFEMAPAAFLADAIKNAPGLKQFTLGLLGREIPTELATTVSQNLNDWVTFNPGKSVSDFIAEQPEALAETAIATIMGASIQAGLIHGAQRATGQFQQMQEERRTKQLQETLTSLFEEAKGIKSDPVTFQSFMAGATDNASVFINADALQETLAQSKIDPATIPSLAEQLAQPSVTGDVEIPIGELMTAFVGTPGQEQIVQHARIRQDDLSAAEQAQFGDMAAFFKKQGAAVAERQKDNEQFVSERQEIEASIVEQLGQASPFGQREHRYYAQMMGAFYSTAAELMGTTPKQIQARWAPNILGATDTVQPATPAPVVLEDWAVPGQAPSRADGTDLVVPPEGVTILHGSGNANLAAADVQIIRQGQKQGKKGRTYGGLYGTFEADIAQAEGYATMMGGQATIYDIRVRPGTKVLNKVGDITRLSEKYITELVAQGYGAVIGKDPRGRTEFVILDPQAIETMQPRGKPTSTLSQGFDHGNAMLNVGLDVGATDRAQKIDADFVKAEIEKLGVQVLSAKEVQGEYEYEGKMVQELTYVPQLSRPLTEAEVNQLAIATGQEAIGQYDNGTGNLWGPNAANWGAFNPEFFKDQVGTKLSDAQKELAQKKTPAKKKATAKPIQDAAAVAEAANITNANKIAATGKFDYIRDLKEQLQNAVRAAAQGADLSATTPEVRKYLTDLGTQEALAALQTNSNAVGWYDEKTRQALSVVALVHPEILTDPDARFTFIYALAVTSNGQRVEKNFELAERAYAGWKESKGTMLSEVGAGGPAGKKVHEALARYNDLVAKFGSPAAVEKFMLTEFTAKELAAAGFDAGGENVDTVVLGAALLGPKIGNGFFANLYGVFDRLTMDRWLMRTWGRWTGTLLKDNQAAVNDEKKVLKALVRAVRADKEANAAMRQVFAMSVKGEVDKALLTAKVSPWEALAKSGNLEHISDQLKLKSTYPPLRKVMQSSALLDQLRKSGNRLAGKLDGSNEAPGGGNQRNWIRAVFNDILQNVVESTGQKMEMADLQALLWYPEKRLYDSAKSDDELGGYEDDEAPDYANAAVALARSKGVSEDAIASALANPADRPAAVRPVVGAAVTRELGSFADRAEEVDGQAGELAQRNRNVGAVAGPVVGIHYSKAPRTSLASSMAGQGMKGAEADRIAASKDPRIKQRVNFYVNTGNGITPESDVGSNPHVATLRNLYDADADALKIWRNSKGDMNVAESAVLDAGFDGYLTRNFGKQGAVVMLGNRSLDVEGISKADVSTRAEQPPSAEIPKMKQAAMAIMQNRALPNGQQSVESWKRDLERSDPDTAALIAWDKIPAGDYYKDQIAGQLWQTTFKPVDTESPAFKRWFGDSKVVDADGKPLRVYHGTAKAFNKVNMKKGAQGVFWMTSDKAAIEAGEVGAAGKGAIMELYARIKNPAGWKEYDKFSIGELIGRGYDGIILPEKDGNLTAVIFEPTQIKSAISNTGEFSDTNPSILFAEAAGPRRGSFNPLTFDLRLLADANRSTFIHEASHFFMAAYIDMASQPDAPPALKQYVEDLLGYLFKNVPGGEQAGGDGLGQKVGAGETARLAPNGKPSKLNTQQWAQVRTPEFKAWFGDWENDPTNASKAVDENGEPKVYYHGSRKAGFLRFDTDGSGKTKGTGAFFTDDYQMAKGYAGGRGDDAPIYTAQEIFTEPEVIDGLEIEEGLLAEVTISTKGATAWQWYADEEAALDALELEEGEALAAKPGYRLLRDGYEEAAGTKDEVVAYIDTQEMETEAKGIYEVFLNVRDLVELDWQDKSWDEGPTDKVWEIFDENGDGYETAYDEEERDRILASNPGYTAEEGAQSPYESTDDAARQGREMGADGILIRDVWDTGPDGYAESGNVLVVYKDTNIKAAFKNTGAFSNEDPNILRQDGGPSQPGAIPEGRTNLERWNAMTLDQQRAYWEFFAEGWEQYAMSGKAPTKALQSAFSAFAKWMKEIYKTLKAFVMQHGTKPLDAELTQYFDRMLATDEELEAARAERGFQALFKNLAESGMSPGQFADYMALDELQKTEAEELLRARSIRDMKWLSGAKSRAIAEIQAEADELRNLVRASVEEDLANTPIRRVERWLKKGEMKVGDDEIAAQAGHRLNMEIVKAMFPEGAIAGQIDFAKLGRGKNALAASTGTMHPDTMAEIANEQFGGEFRNGEDLVRQLIDMPPFKDEVSQLTDLQMLEEHGDLATPEAIAKAADVAIHNDAHLKMLATELWALNNRTGSVAALTKAAKAFAQNLVDGTVVKKLRPVQFVNAATRAGKAVVRAHAKGELDKAATEKRTEVVNAAAAKAAYAAEAEVRAIMNRLRKISAYSDKHSSVMTREFSVVQAVRAILSEFEIGSKGEKAGKYLELVQEYDPTLGAVLDATIKQLAPVTKPWDQLKVAELRELREAVDGLWRAAKEVRTVELNGEKMDLDAARARLLAQIEKIPAKMRKSKAFSLTKAEQRNQKFMSAVAKGIRPEALFAMMDGTDEYGEFTQLIWNTINDAQLGLNTEKEARLRQLKALLEPIMADMTDVKIDAPELGGTFGEGHVIGYSELLHAILHSGNLSNLERLLVGRGWGSVREDGTLDTTKWDAFMKRMFAEGKITQKHMTFVQAVWDLLEELKPAAQAAHRATTGRFFPEIEAKEIVTPFGVYRGGYAPAIADRGLAPAVDMQAMLNDAQQDVMQTFEKPWAGFAKERTTTAAGGRPLELNIAALGRHIDSVLVFSHMSVPIRNVQRVLKGDALSKAVSAYSPEATANVIAPWLHSAAVQSVTEKGKHSAENMAVWTKLRSRAGMAVMFANISNSIQQLTGFFPALALISKKEMLFAAAKGWYQPRALAASVADMSPYMAQRLDNEARALTDEIDQILLNPTKLETAQAWANRHAYFLQMSVDMVMSPIIWQARFNQTMAEGKNAIKEPGDLEALQAKAIHMADSAVRMTQGSNRAIDVAAIEKGSPLYRLFLQFAGWANSQANLLGMKLAREKLMPNTPAKYGRITSYLALVWWAPAIASMIVAVGMRGGPDDDDGDGLWDDWLAELLMAPVKMATSAVPFVGPALMTAFNAFNDKPYDDKMSVSPVISLVEGGFRGTAAAAGAIEDPTKTGRAIRDLGSFFSLFTGVPITPATKAIGYATDVETGKVSPTGPVDYGRGIITGVASPASKQ